MGGRTPWASIASGTDGDITITWDRRTRVGGALIPGQSTVPISEDSELYDIDYFSAAAASTIIRTTSSLVSAVTVYTSAQQATDGLSPPLSTITVEVFQRSAQVGRGFSTKETIDVE